MKISGAIFHNNRKSRDNQPDVTGEMELDQEVLRTLMRDAQADPEGVVKVRLAGWNKVSKGGARYLSLNGEPKSAADQARGNATRAARQARPRQNPSFIEAADDAVNGGPDYGDDRPF